MLKRDRKMEREIKKLEHQESHCIIEKPCHIADPKHPQANGHLERFNRTIQEQFVELYLDFIDEPAAFNLKLMDYLIWYNTEKLHRGIGNLPPLRYYLDNFIVTSKKSNMLWMLTWSCLIS